MPKARVFHETGFEDQPVTILARVKYDGSNITQAGISSITMLAKRLAQGTPVETLASTGLTVGQVVFDTLQTDDRWTRDSSGYNFAATVPKEAFPAVDEYYVAFAFTPTSGSPFVVMVRVTIISNIGALE